MRCRRPLNLRASFKLDERERGFLRPITPGAVEQMIQKKVEKILAKGAFRHENKKWGDGVECWFESVGELIKYVEMEAWGGGQKNTGWT
jgi:hypothetical protein